MKTPLKKIIFSFILVQLMTLTFLLGNNKDSLKLITAEKPTIFKEIKENNLQAVTIYTAIDSILLNKKTNNSYPATFVYTNTVGKKLEKSVTLKPRGKSRRLYCSFPPLKISFSDKDLLSTGLRKKHRSLKMVTHCNTGADANQNVLKELLAYQIYNELSHNSLKVQLLKVTYRDINSDDSLERYAILIEDIDELAEQKDSKEVESFGKSLNDFEQNNANIFALFQFMIGNPDWKIRNQSNVKFIQSNVDKGLKLIPYDFDSSGFVHPKYARPLNHLGLKSMKQRLFMGQFKNKSAREQVITLFNNKKESIYSLIKNCKQLNSVNRKETIAYLDVFYEIINSKRHLNRAIPIGNKTPELTALNGEMGF